MCKPLTSVPNSRRLTFRALQLTDTQSLLKILGDKEVMSFYPSVYDSNDVKNWIYRNRTSYEDNGFGLWALELKESKKFIGQCGLTMQQISKETLPEVGFHIQKSYWNRGYGLEAVTAVVEYTRSFTTYNKIYIQTYCKNIPAQILAIKAGFRKIMEYNKLMKKDDLVWKHFVYQKEIYSI